MSKDIAVQNLTQSELLKQIYIYQTIENKKEKPNERFRTDQSTRRILL